MNIGSLYKVKEYFWLLFPSKEISTSLDALGPIAATARLATSNVAHWSKRFKCNVSYFSPDSYIVFLEEDRELKRVLTSDGKIGWTCFFENYNHCFEEVKTES